MDLSSESIESYKQDLISQINNYRNKHGTKNLINDIKIDNIAQKFASKLAKKGKLDYSSNEYKGQILGETVYKSQSYFAPLKLAKALYDENSQYNYKSSDPEPNNFTQMVWKDSTHIGFGIAKSNDGKYFYVINYFPTGNVDGEFKKNVFPPGTITQNEKGNNKIKKKEEIIKKNKDETENKKYVIKKIEKEYKINNKGDKNFGKEFEKFNKNFDDSDIEDEEEEEEDDDNSHKIYIMKNETKTKNDNRKNILAELIKNKKKELGKQKNYKENENYDYKIVYNNNDYSPFCIDMLEWHNKYRKMHHVPPLKLNKEICIISENYAKILATQKNCLEHSDNEYKGKELGENVYCSYGMEVNGSTVVKKWYDEINKYNFNEDWQSGCGHFTQVIWKDSKEVGFGKCKDKNGFTYVVANYFPAGNYIGFFKFNVFKK